MTFFGTASLMTVSLIEVTFYISALHQKPPGMGAMSLGVISAVQHLYFVIAAPAVFLPLGMILGRSDVLPKLFGYLAIALAIVFFISGAIFMLTLTLPDPVTALGAVQALWWLAAAAALILRRNRYVKQTSNSTYNMSIQACPHSVDTVAQDPSRTAEPPYFGWLSSRIEIYPDTAALKTNVRTQAVGKRPLIELQPTDHPLAVEQRSGITEDRLIEIPWRMKLSERQRHTIAAIIRGAGPGRLL